jgi:hypothetical protein
MCWSPTHGASHIGNVARIPIRQPPAAIVPSRRKILGTESPALTHLACRVNPALVIIFPDRSTQPGKVLGERSSSRPRTCCLVPCLGARWQPTQRRYLLKSGPRYRTHFVLTHWTVSNAPRRKKGQKKSLIVRFSSARKLRMRRSDRAMGDKKYSQLHCRAVLNSVKSALD